MKFKSILLIDDDEAINEFHEIIISQVDITHNIHSVLSGQEGLDYLKSQGTYNDEENAFPQPELIFLDINMPAMNGFEFMVEYDKLDKEQKAKYVIVMLTSSLNPDDKKESEKYSDIIDFLNKPLTKDSLFKLRDRILL